MEETTTQPKSNSSTMMIVLIGIAILAVIVGAMWFSSMSAKKNPVMEKETSEQMEEEPSVTEEKESSEMMENAPGETGSSTPSVEGDKTSLDEESVVNDDTSAMESNVKEFTVEGSNFKFMPATLAVNKGDTVRVTFKNSGGMHDFKIDEFKVATKVIEGGAEETVEFVADKSGTFEYYCSVGSHRSMGMKGVLTVK